MYKQADSSKRSSQYRANAHDTDALQKKTNESFSFQDNRPEAILQRKLQEGMKNSPQNKQAVQLQAMADNYAAQQFTIQKKENKTGLPDKLKSGIENLSGYSMDDVKVHYNSSKPAQLQAHAYAQGTDIHLGSGQEKHLPHEAWHVVQQKQGRVKPTMQMKGMNVNDDVRLEREAGVMGEKAFGNVESNKQLKKQKVNERSVQLITAKKLGMIKGLSTKDLDRLKSVIRGKLFTLNDVVDLYCEKNLKVKWKPDDLKIIIDFIRENKPFLQEQIKEKRRPENYRVEHKASLLEKDGEKLYEWLEDIETSKQHKEDQVQMDKSGNIGKDTEGGLIFQISRATEKIGEHSASIMDKCGITAKGKNEWENDKGIDNAKGNHACPANTLKQMIVDLWVSGGDLKTRIARYRTIVEKLSLGISIQDSDVESANMKEIKKFFFEVIKKFMEFPDNIYYFPYNMGDNDGTTVDGPIPLPDILAKNSELREKVNEGWELRGKDFNSLDSDTISEAVMMIIQKNISAMEKLNQSINSAYKI